MASSHPGGREVRLPEEIFGSDVMRGRHANDMLISSRAAISSDEMIDCGEGSGAAGAHGDQRCA